MTQDHHNSLKENRKIILQKLCAITFPDTNESLEQILQIVAEHYHQSPEEIKGKCRKRELVLPRQISQYIAKKCTKLSLGHIGDFYDGRDHSTVINAVNTVQDLIDTDVQFTQELVDILEKVEMLVKVYLAKTGFTALEYRPHAISTAPKLTAMKYKSNDKLAVVGKENSQSSS